MTEMLPLTSLLPPPSAAEVDIAGISDLTPAAKAAIVVRLLLNEGADLPLEDLPDDLQVRLTRQMSEMRMVDRDTLQSVVLEFATAVDRVGLHFPPGIAGALGVLDGSISKHTAARLRQEAGVRQYGDPWKRLSELGPDKLLPIFETESIEIAAVALSKLPVSLAAELLGKIPGPRARRITYAVSLTSAVTPEAVDRIGLSLASQLDALPASAFEGDPVERVGAILNSSTNLTRTDVLTGLDETDHGFAEAVRKAIFTFAHIPTRIAARDIPRILREVDNGALVTALAGAPQAGFEAARDFLLENMSARMADQLREEVAEMGKVKASDAEEAMAGIVETVRAMEQAGDLIFIVEEED
ncbi:MAG: FliG C-terminal domain-containing protein [Sulfitobacter sp.]|nr:FliG C-terminal domain-containing protein [Sulfitobacter sp.]